MSLGDNGATGYQVSYSGAVLQELKRLQADLSGADQIRRFTAALQVIHARLRTDPLVFGEHWYFLPNLKVSVRTAAVRPLHVSYAVHEDRHLVFIREFRLLGGHGP